MAFLIAGPLESAASDYRTALPHRSVQNVTQEASPLQKAADKGTRRHRGLLSFAGEIMNREAILDELRRLEGEAVQGERVLAQHEAQLVTLAKQNQDTSKVQAALNLMRDDQRRLDEDRQRLLALLQR